MTINLSKVIKSDHQSVLRLFENPENLPRYHPYFTSVEVKEKEEKVEKASGNRVTEYRITVHESAPASGIPFNISAVMNGTYIVRSESERSVVSMDVLYRALGITMNIEIQYTIAPNTTDGEILISDVFRLWPPRMLSSSSEKTARTSHEIMLENMKAALEGKSE